MPSIRSGFGSDFVLKNEKIGIGSETPINTLDVGGAIKGNLSIAGVATLTSYGGFVAQNQHINKASSIGFGTVGLQTGVGIITSVQYYETETGFTDLGGVHHGDDQYYNTLSEDLVIDEGQILNITSIDMVGFTTIGEYDPHSHQSHVCLGALEELSVIDHFSVPCGGSNDRQSFIEGTIRFNDDLNTLEFFNGNEWRQFTYNQGQSGRGVFGGGATPNRINNIDYINIASRGNALDFGDLTVGRSDCGSCSSEIRGIWTGGFDDSTPTYNNQIDYVTLASEGNAIDFGNLSIPRQPPTSFSSSTRGISMGGYALTPSVPSNQYCNVIDYVELSTLGNALDFGDTITGRGGCGSFSSSTRGVIGGGLAPLMQTDAEFVTIASKGNAVRFGDLINGLRFGGASNSIRGIFTSAEVSGPGYYGIGYQYVTIATTGSAEYFGEMASGASRNKFAGTSNRTRAVFGGGSTDSGKLNTLEYLTIATTGNAQDFGDLTIARSDWDGACSDSHGGLGGF